MEDISSQKENFEKEVNYDYGFRANLRTGVFSLKTRIDFLEKIFTVKFDMSIRNVLFYGAEIIVIGLGTFIFLMNFQEGFAYIGIWVILMSAMLIILLGYHAFLLPAGGTLFSGVLNYIVGIIQYIGVKWGWINRPTKTNISKVYDDGVVEFSNGDSGVFLIMDGMTSAQSFPSEIVQLQETSKEYQNARNSTTTEISITETSKQDVSSQIESNKIFAKKTENLACRSLINTQVKQYQHNLNGKYSTVVQHKLLRDSSYKELEKRLNTINRYTSDGGGLYYGAEALNKEEVEVLLKTFYGLK